MRFLLRAIPDSPDRAASLSSIQGLAKSLGARVTHPRWTSYGALEVDVFVPSEQDLDLLTSVIEPLAKLEFARNLDEPPKFKSKERILEEAISYFNSERFWECHEALEGVWRPARGKEKLLLQAIILVCAALVHEQRDEREVALGIFARALPRISWDERLYHGIDVDRLRTRVEEGLSKGLVAPFRI